MLSYLWGFSTNTMGMSLLTIIVSYGSLSGTSSVSSPRDDYNIQMCFDLSFLVRCECPSVNLLPIRICDGEQPIPWPGYVYHETHARKERFSDGFGIRRPVHLEPFQTNKYATPLSYNASSD